ncbi:TIGR03862 family flavoprotein [Paracoccus pacificus]|uniref:TIGR03862 family flavoprotein n=1 Tax=Paracoccus pacificus TaxID=1463598 RepID=A0ABW4R383_9RHOB
MSETVEALVIGAGPAGLMAAETLGRSGARVVVAEAMPTPARKFLMAGKSGLNLTRDEPHDRFLSRLSTGALPRTPGYLTKEDLLDGFGPAEAMGWATGLGITLFTGSTGRVFPVGMKASPLLRAWLARLSGLGVELRTRWAWRGFDAAGGFVFDTPGGPATIAPRATVLALGGASWPRLGSDGGWMDFLAARGVGMTPFQPANMGFRVDWSAAMAAHFGAAVKGVAIHAGGRISRGEWVVTAAGIEGGGIYEIAAAVRDGAPATVDLMPDVDEDTLTERFSHAPAKLSVGNRLRRVLGDPVRAALMMEWGRPLPRDGRDLAHLAKRLPLRHAGPMALERAISSAGGIRLDGLTRGLELRAVPGVFVAGEMLDWEAPTGGYLLTTCLATGRRAGLAAAQSLAVR